MGDASVVDIDVILPQKRSSQFGTMSRKPMGTVTFHLDDGGREEQGGSDRSIKVPLRVARVLRDEPLPVPLDVDEAFDRVHALEGRVCLAMLTEMLNRRDHSSDEARSKLRAYGFRDQEIDAAVERATSLRFLDDNRFSSYFIEERKRRGWGRRKIEIELKRKGIEPSEVPGWPDAYFTDDDDHERAAALLGRKSIPERNPREKLIRFLVSKGFSFRVAADVVDARLDG